MLVTRVNDKASAHDPPGGDAVAEEGRLAKLSYESGAEKPQGLGNIFGQDDNKKEPQEADDVRSHPHHPIEDAAEYRRENKREGEAGQCCSKEVRHNIQHVVVVLPIEYFQFCRSCI